MNLYEWCGKTEDHDIYQIQRIGNLYRLDDFFESLVFSAVHTESPFLSQKILKALNFHAISCLHERAGEYRQSQVYLDEFEPPEHHEVPGLMEEFINQVNRRWGTGNFLELAAFTLWRFLYIHPFINGNGRTARAACYFVICLHFGGLLPGSPNLAEAMRHSENRQEYLAALKFADNNNGDLTLLEHLIAALLDKQLSASQNQP